MSLMRVFDITGSAMSAQSIRLNTTASNLANADSVNSSEDKTYKARVPVFAADMEDARRNMFSSAPEAVPVKVLGIVEKSEPLKMEYNPGHPLANDKGYIYKPNVNIMEEMTTMIETARAYQVVAEIAKTAEELAVKTLTIGAGG